VFFLRFSSGLQEEEEESRELVRCTVPKEVPQRRDGSCDQPGGALWVTGFVVAEQVYGVEAASCEVEDGIRRAAGADASRDSGMFTGIHGRGVRQQHL